VTLLASLWHNFYVSSSYSRIYSFFPHLFVTSPQKTKLSFPLAVSDVEGETSDSVEIFDKLPKKIRTKALNEEKAALDRGLSVSYF
jgi:hypothetical protein